MGNSAQDFSPVSDATLRAFMGLMAEALAVIRRQGDLLEIKEEAISNKKLAEFYGVSVWTIGRWRKRWRAERALRSVAGLGVRK